MTNKIEIISTVNLTEAQIAEIKEQHQDIVLHDYPDLSVEEIPQDIWENCDILLTWTKIPGGEIAPKIRWVQTLSAGVDSINDHPLFDNPNIFLTTASGANAPQVAEHALALLLSMARKIPDLAHLQSRGEWSSTLPNHDYLPTELRNSTVGILGYGSLGRQIARLLQPFNCEILVTKRNAKSIKDTGYILKGTGDEEGEFFTRLYPTEATRSLVEECDYIIITLPLTDQTKGYVNETLFTNMKPNVILIDVSRGGIVDHNALIGALVNNQIAGAALDVFPTEPLSNESSLWQFANVFISPHVAGVSQKYMERAIRLFLENLNRHLNGHQLFNIVNHDTGY